LELLFTSKLIIFFLDDIQDDPACIVLVNIPRVIFFSAFSLLILFWAEIIHKVRNHATSFDRKRTCFITTNVVIYVIQLAFWIPIFFLPKWSASSGVPKIENLGFSVLSTGIGALFLVFGGRLFVMLKSFPIESKGRTSKLIEVGAVTVICCLCFFLRASFLVLTSFDMAIDTNTYVLLAYYFMVEILPCIMVLVILSRLPPEPHQSIESNYPEADMARNNSRGSKRVHEEEEIDQSRSLILSPQNVNEEASYDSSNYGTVQ